ncbi:MAG: YraN family protein [Acidobacteriota bacterium]|nr:YraN family protein [Acidobacteriota bacterium]
MCLPAALGEFVARVTGLLRGPRTMRGSRGVGQRWEDLAARHLRREGYRILARNFRAGPGEIDFIAMEGRVLCFIEVKGRGGAGFGLPEEAVDEEKQRRIHRAAEAWLQRQRPASGLRRFDVVSILERSGVVSIRLFRGAFEAPSRARTLPRRR